MKNFREFMEAVEFPDEFQVRLKIQYIDQPTLMIPGWGYIRLFYSGHGDKPHWSVHMIQGDRPGAGTPLYFAALLWALNHGDKLLVKNLEKPTHGLLGSDSTLSPDAVRARLRLQTQYGDYLYIMPNPRAKEIKVHRNDKSDWRRPATNEEATLWRLKKMLAI